MVSKPDYRFVELALHNFIRNGYVKRVEEIDSLVDSQMTDCCRTWATYPMKLKNHCENKGSIRGYNGLVSADFIPVDIFKLFEIQEIKMVSKRPLANQSNVRIESHSLVLMVSSEYSKKIKLWESK